MSAAAIPMSPLMGCTNEAAQFGHAFSKGCWRQCCYFEGFSFCSEPPVEAQPFASCFMLRACYEHVPSMFEASCASWSLLFQTPTTISNTGYM